MGKRANHEGNITYRKKEKRWKGEIMVGYHDDGRPRRISVYGKTRAVVLEKLDAIKRDLKDDIAVVGIPTFRQLSELWKSKLRVSNVTRAQYEYILKRILAEFGSCKVTEITPDDIEEFMLKLAGENYSASYLNKVQMIMNKIFKLAKKRKAIRQNPMDDVDSVDACVEEKKREYFTLEEIQKLHRELPLDRLGDSLRLMAGTGIRLGELLAITKHSFEREGFLRIHKAIKYVNGKIEIGGPKSEAGIRDVEIPAPFIPAAKRLQEQCNDGYLWEVGVSGQPCHPSCFRKHFKLAVESILGPTTKTPHALRHSYATIVADRGVSSTVIKQLLGQATLKVTEDVYIHELERAQHQAVEKLSEHFTAI